PRGKPPIPRATLMAILPDGIALMGGRFSSPRRMIAPLPKSFSIWAIARSRALDRSFCAAVVAFFFGAMTLSSFSRLYFRSGLYKFKPPTWRQLAAHPRGWDES